MSDLAARVYELSDDEYVRLHLPEDTIDCTLQEGRMQGDETNGDWRWLATETQGDSYVLIRIPFRDGEMRGVAAHVVDSPEANIDAGNAQKVTDIEVLDRGAGQA
ncbi:hypothetical protein [Halolamina salifodinae]|uniref:Uncharacterized protein n=1 Tax=Halolamina salifodinae TaxID=1202767 RepID=A0A8T4GT45_9EURY|nr:hypothetical protein [Halolamina salifodinae]MBP1986036.1 hypothetical protein [Halolamina salifodinae]